MKLVVRFWKDEAGVIISSELILVITILVIGLIAGMTTLRDAVTLELGDTAAAIGFIEQDYSFTGTTNGAANATTSGSTFVDLLDTGDEVDTAGSDSGNGVNVGVAATQSEG